jgi:hypothetical protein
MKLDTYRRNGFMNAQITFTEILGFSQSYQWYTGQPFEFPPSDPTFGLQKAFLSTYNGFSNCQARFGFGGDLTKWKDTGFIGYEGHVAHNLRKDRKEITRLSRSKFHSRGVATA